MTEAQAVKRVTYWQNRLSALGLGHWDIGVSFVDDPDDNEEASAAMHTSHFYDSADMEIARSALDRDDLDSIIIHELLHSAFRGLEVAEDGTLHNLAYPEAAAHRQRLEYERENLIQRLALCLTENCGTVQS